MNYHQPDLAGRIVNALGKTQGRDDQLPLGNQYDPFDELIYIILTTMTQYGVTDVFDDLRVNFQSWDELLKPGAEERLRQTIARCGLVNQKAPQIIAVARRVHADFERVTLDPLKAMSDEDAEAYLVSLPRVGKKVARCVMLYSLGRDVLPVDAHVLRVSQRLGLLPPEMRWAKAHDAIHEVVPPELRYSVHVGFVEHGREVCMHKNPRCESCALQELCPESS